MKCDEPRELLSLHDAEALGWWKRRQVQRHLHGCAECRQELSALKATAKLIAETPRAEAPTEIWRGIEAALDAEPVRPATHGSMFPRRLATGLAGAAVVGGIAIGVYVLQTPSDEPHVFDQPAPFVRYHSILAQNDPLSDQVGLDIHSAVLVSHKSDEDARP